MTTTSTTTTIQHSRQYFLTTNMDSAADKEERKREYNRLAQREFRRRRKEHLKNLEQAQKEQNTEQSEEIERLRYQNDELRRENEALRAQLFGTTSQGLLLAPVGGQLPTDHRQYSLSPSISGASMSNAGSPPASLSSDFMPMASMSMTSSMNHASMHAYTDPIALSSQPYSMVPQSGLRSHNAQSSPESSGYQRNPAMGSSSFQHPSLNIPRTGGSSISADQSRSSSSRPNVSIVMSPYDRKKACTQIRELFHPLISDPAVLNATSPERHLAILRSMADVLPPALKPSKTQLETPHFYAIDMIASPSLRERLMNLTRDVARSFIQDFGSCIGEAEDVGQLIIWGDDPYNEISWEVSQSVLERWGWLLGRDFVDRSNAWRRQRGAPPLPEW